MAVASLLSCCSYDITKAHPEFLDIKHGYARIYDAKKISNPACGEPNYSFAYSGKTIPIEEMNGHICFPVDQVQDIEAHYNEWIKQNQHCN